MNGWTWRVGSARIALYQTRPDRGGKVIQSILRGYGISFRKLVRSTTLISRVACIFRKITGGFRSETGTMNHDVLMSRQQTARLNDEDPLTLFRHILTAPSKSLLPDYCLSP
jgi:hypothetical protein